MRGGGGDRSVTGRAPGGGGGAAGRAPPRHAHADLTSLAPHERLHPMGERGSRVYVLLDLIRVLEIIWMKPLRRPRPRELRAFFSCMPRRAVCGQGDSREAPGKSGLHAHGEGERVLALESREGTRASPSTCAGDLRELSGVPLRSQGYCGVAPVTREP